MPDHTPCPNQHAIDMLETDRDNVVERLNIVIAGQGEMKQQVSVLMERVPVDLKEQLVRINTAVNAHNEFRSQVYKFVTAILMALCLGWVGWVIAGGMKVAR